MSYNHQAWLTEQAATEATRINAENDIFVRFFSKELTAIANGAEVTVADLKYLSSASRKDASANRKYAKPYTLGKSKPFERVHSANKVHPHALVIEARLDGAKKLESLSRKFAKLASTIN